MDIEQALIGGLIKNPDALADIEVELGDIVSKDAKIAFIAINRLWGSSEPVDLVTVAKECGMGINPAWLAESTDVGLSSSVVHIAGRIRNDAIVRRLRDRLKQLSSDKFIKESTELVSLVQAAIDSEHEITKKAPDIKSVVSRFEKHVEKNITNGIGIGTWFKFFTEKNMTYYPGHYWIIGAYTSVGKTTFMIEMVVRLLLNTDARVLIFSTEMSDNENTAKILANLTGFNAKVIESGKTTTVNVEKIDRWKKELMLKNLFIYDDVFSLDQIVAKTKVHKKRNKIDIVFVDFLQNVSAEGVTEYDTMKTIARRLQRLAKETQTCFVCLSQIPNNAAKADAGILEFKGAGEFAAACDNGLWMKRDPTDKTKILLDLRKSRFGALGKQVLQYQDGYTRLEEIKHDDNE